MTGAREQEAAREGGEQAPDRLFWNLAIFMMIPVLVLLLVAAWLARRASAVPSAGAPRPAPTAPAGPR